MEKLKIAYRFLGVILVIGLGLFSGSILNSDNAQAEGFSSLSQIKSLAINESEGGGGCSDGLACKNDHVSGFRCFYTGNTTYTCDDSNYPQCSETRCQ